MNIIVVAPRDFFRAMSHKDFHRTAVTEGVMGETLFVSIARVSAEDMMAVLDGAIAALGLPKE